MVKIKSTSQKHTGYKVNRKLKAQPHNNYKGIMKYNFIIKFRNLNLYQMENNSKQPSVEGLIKIINNINVAVIKQFQDQGFTSEQIINGYEKWLKTQKHALGLGLNYFSLDVNKENENLEKENENLKKENENLKYSDYINEGTIKALHQTVTEQRLKSLEQKCKSIKNNFKL